MSTAAQVPARTGRAAEAPGPVRLSGGRLVVSGLMVTDPQVVAAAAAAERAGADLTEWLTGCLRAGVAAVTVASAGADLARVEAAVQALTATVAENVDQAVARLTRSVTAAVAPGGPLATAVEGQVTRLATGVQGLITGPDATVPTRIAREVQAVTDSALREIQRALAAQSAAVNTAVTADRDTVRAQVSAAVTGQQVQIQAALAQVTEALALREQATAAQARQSGRGFTYEQDVLNLIGAIATDAGDGGLTPTGGLAGTAGTRKGDGIVDLVSAGPGLRLVVEAKDRASNPLSVAQWRDELAAARTNRAAQVAIGVTRPEHMPVPGQLVAVLTGTDLLVAYDPGAAEQDVPTAVYLVARLLARIAATPDTTETADLITARRHADALIEALTTLDGANRHIRSIQTSATTLATLLGQAKEAMRTRAEGIRTALAE